MSKQRLTISMSPYDRVLPLMLGEVSVKGIDLTWSHGEVEEGFWRMLHTGELNACEFSMSSYLMLQDKGDHDLTAIPVFSRMFRHGAIYVHTASGIREPRDLVGKKVGVSEYQVTAALWVRGILQHEYGVHPSDMLWFEGPLESAVERRVHLNLAYDRPSRPIQEHQTLNQMLLDGEIDALVSARAPSAFLQKDDRVRRLFANPMEVEQAYFRKTGFFPIMHTLVLRGEVLRRAPWIAQNLYTAFDEAKRRCLAELAQSGAPKAIYPWLGHAVEQARNLMGVDYMPYGVAENREILSAMVQYACEQGLISRVISLEELFFPPTLDEFRV